MKLEIIGMKEAGYLIRGKVSIAQEVTIRHQGKVERVVVVTTKRMSPTGVRFDKARVISKEGKMKAKGLMSKGLSKHADIIALGGIMI